MVNWSSLSWVRWLWPAPAAVPAQYLGTWSYYALVAPGTIFGAAEPIARLWWISMMPPTVVLLVLLLLFGMKRASRGAVLSAILLFASAASWTAISYALAYQRIMPGADLGAAFTAISRTRTFEMWMLSVVAWSGLWLVVTGRVMWAAGDLVPRGSDIVRRADSGSRGTATWASRDRLLSMFGNGGMVFGEAYDVSQTSVAKIPFEPRDRVTWGEGGTHPLLRFSGDDEAPHAIFFAGSGGYKTSSIGIPTALSWPTGLIYLDPTKKVDGLVGHHRTEAFGHKVYCLDPDDEDTDWLNVLEFVRRDSDHLLDDVDILAEAFRGKGSKGENASWEEQALILIRAALVDTLTSPSLDEWERTLSVFRHIVALPTDDQKKLLKSIYADPTSHPLAKRLAGQIYATADKQYDGLRGFANNMCSWLDSPGLARITTGQGLKKDPVDLRAVADGRATVFLKISSQTLLARPGVARVLLACIVAQMQRIAEDAERGKCAPITGRVMLMLDEAARLGGMPALELARDIGRHAGLSVVALYQSPGQLQDAFGREGAQSWFDSSKFLSFGAATSEETAEMASKMLGEFTTISYSRNRSHRKGQLDESETMSEQGRRLIDASEFRRMRSDEQILIGRSMEPARVGRSIWFRRPELRDLVEKSVAGAKAKAEAARTGTAVVKAD